MKCGKCKFESTENIPNFFFELGRKETEGEEGDNTYSLAGTSNLCKKCEKELNNIIEKFFNH